ncbi:MAG: 3-deoxy-D-manno-octulosonic acid transferase [Nitrospirae bacterium]|nr:3-deoxy-D-manno-octulosonic acid transferase [Nitrospirota bacterium]
MLLLYNILSTLVLLIYLPRLIFKKGPADRLRYLSERLGVSQYAAADIWVHAVSVGETIACMPFLKQLKKEFPQMKIVFSTTTYTGQGVALEKFPEADRIMYMPWDSGLCAGRAVKFLAPEIFVTMETELWPQLFKKLKGRGSRIVVINGRISNNSFKGYKRIRPFIKKVLTYVDVFYMQGKNDAERIIALGAEQKRVSVTGNFKFDINLPAVKHHKTWLDNIEGRILVAGSTHRGEDEIVLEAFKSVRESIPDLKLVLAPRHPERFQEAEDILKKKGFNFIRRTEMEERGQGIEGEKGHRAYDVILLNTIGELTEVYSAAAVVFVGGSLLPYGGHNIMEPAYWAKPVVFGPHMDNFMIAEEFLRQGAALMVKDAGDMANAVTDLLQYPDKAKEMGQRAKVITEENTGAVRKAVELIRNMLNEAGHHGTV